MIRTLHGGCKKKTITGFIGSAVGANDLFGFGKIEKFPGDREGFSGLTTQMTVMRKRTNAGWKKVRISIEVVDEGNL